MKRWGRFIQFLLLLGSLGLATESMAADSWWQQEPPEGNQWFATFGGEWDFVSNDGAPFNGEDWQELHAGLGHTWKGQTSLYFQYRFLGRTDRFDHILGVEAYQKIYKKLWLRAAVNGSPDNDFAYILRTNGELEYNFPYLAVGAGYWYLHYNPTDVHVATPFARFYWKEFSLEFRYLCFDTDSDEQFNAFAGKGSYNFDHRWARPFAGFAAGGLLFGILTVQEDPNQKGFIIYGGNRLGLTPRLDLVPMVSWAREDVSFEYIGVAADLILRF